MFKKFLFWWKASRPQADSASLCPVLVGLIVGGVEKPLVAVLTAFCALSLQKFSNFVNDYFDFVRGTDGEERKGFKKPLVEGQASIGQIRTACIVSLTCAALSGIVLVIEGGLPILAIGVTAMLFAWLYTATDHSLSYLGIADIFVLIYYGILAGIGTVYLQTGEWSCQAFWAGAVNGLISMLVLATNNIRDIENDRVAGKRTFPVRFGKKVAETGYLVIVLLMPLCCFLAFGLCWAMLVVVPGILLYGKVLRSEGAQYNKCLLMAGLLNVLYTLLCLLSV